MFIRNKDKSFSCDSGTFSPVQFFQHYFNMMPPGREISAGIPFKFEEPVACNRCMVYYSVPVERHLCTIGCFNHKQAQQRKKVGNPIQPEFFSWQRTQ